MGEILNEIYDFSYWELARYTMAINIISENIFCVYIKRLHRA